MKWKLLFSSLILCFSSLIQADIMTASTGSVGGSRDLVANGTPEGALGKAAYLAFEVCAKKNANLTTSSEAVDCEWKKRQLKYVKICSALLVYQCSPVSNPLAIGYGRDGRFVQRAQIRENGKVNLSNDKAFENALMKCEDPDLASDNFEFANYCEKEVQHNKTVTVCKSIASIACSK